MTPKYCSFCRAINEGSVATGNAATVIDNSGDEVTVKREEDGEALIVPVSHEDFVLEGQLKTVFVLRKLLDLSETTCAKYLKKLNTGAGRSACHPSDWLKLCGKCDELVEECYRIYREMVGWRRRLEAKKEGLKMKIGVALGKKWEEVGDNLDSLIGNSVGFQKEEELIASSFETQQRRRSSRIRNFLQPSNLADLEADNLGNKEDDIPLTSRRLPLNSKSPCSDDEWQPSDSEMEAVTEDNMAVAEPPLKVQVPSLGDAKNYPGLDLSAITRRRYRCNMCVASYDVKKRLDNHLKVHKLPLGIAVKCGRCGWTFQAKVRRSHEKDCLAATKMFYCSFCPASYLQKRGYLKHIILHDKTKCREETRACAMCGWVTTRKDIKHHFFNKHRKPDVVQTEVEGSKIPYYCDHCHIIFPSQMHIISHVNFGHKDKPLLECDKCSVGKFESKQLLQIHCGSAHGEVHQDDVETKEEESPCPHCSERFPTKMKRDYHIAKCHLKEQLVCPVCKTFQAKEFNILRKHMATHDAAYATRSIVCEICSKVIRPESLRSHMILVHSTYPPNCQPRTNIQVVFHNCPDCPARYQMIKSYQMHRKLHEDKQNKGKVMNCVRCGWLHKKSKFVLKRSQRHNCPRGTKRAVKCDLCPAVYNTLRCIQAHRKLHENPDAVEGHFTCEKCGWLCLPSERLTHGKIKCLFKDEISKEEEEEDSLEGTPYYCDYCHVMYTNVRYLEIHCKSAHGNKTLLKCSMCEEKFYSSQLLDEHHLEKHSDNQDVARCVAGTQEEVEERDFQCPHCLEKFATKSKRDYHIARLHQDLMLKCTVCGYEGGELWELLGHCKLLKHDMGKKIICEICSKPQNRNSYIFHVRALHFQNVVEELTSSEVISEKLDEQQQVTEQREDTISAEEDNYRLEAPEEFHQVLEDNISTSPHSPAPASPDNSMHFNSDDEADPEEESLSDPSWDPESESPKRKSKSKEIRHKKKIIIRITSSKTIRKNPSRRVKLVDKIKKRGRKPASDWNSRKPTENNEIINSSHDPTTSTTDSSIPRKQFQCWKCPASYNVETKLIIHMTLHDYSPRNIYTCKTCGWVFSNRSEKGQNPCNCESRMKRLKCSLCPARFKFKKNYEKHRLKHENKSTAKQSRSLLKKITAKRKEEYMEVDEGTPFYCDHCHFIFVSQATLVRHFQMAHKKYKPLLECDLCTGIKFESKQLLQMHRKRCHNAEDVDNPPENAANVEESSSTIIPCKHCSETFPTKTKLDYHIAKDHWKTQLTCPICEKYTAKEPHTLRLHMHTHDPNGTTMCEICSKMIRKTTMESHKQLFHYKELGLEPIQCKECQMIFRSEKVLKNHVDFVHLHNTPSCCHLCTKKYKNKGDLDKHIQTHMNPKKLEYKKGPFFCKICDAKFNVRQGLYYHMKRLHSDKYLYRCETCGKGYCFENTLLDHQKSCKKNVTSSNEPEYEQL